MTKAETRCVRRGMHRGVHRSFVAPVVRDAATQNSSQTLTRARRVTWQTPLPARRIVVPRRDGTCNSTMGGFS